MNIDKEALDRILQERSDKYCCYLRLVKQVGKRYSFICGRTPDYPLPSENMEIPLKNSFILTGQRRSGGFTPEDLLNLKETGEFIEKYLS